MERLPKILITGEIKTEYLISASGKVVADQPGGNLLYAAAGASLWSEYQKDVGLISKIGVNYPKENLEKILDEGFNSDGIRILDQKLEHRSFIAYTDLRTSHTKSPISYFSQTGDTFPVSLLGYKGDKYGSDKITLDEQIIFSEDDLPDDYSFSNAAHLCPLDLKSHRLFPEILRRAKITHVSVDPGDRYMQPSLFNDIPNILQGLTAFLPSESELKNLFQGRTEDLWEMVEELGGMGCSFVVVKSGENGQNLYDAESKKKYHIPAFPSHIVDITGAGDVFCGGFIAGLEQYNDPLQAVLLGNIAASFAVEGSGAFYTNDVLEGLQMARLEKLKTFVREI